MKSSVQIRSTTELLTKPRFVEERTVRPAGQPDKKCKQAAELKKKKNTDLSWASRYITSCLQIGFCTPDNFVCNENFQGKKKLIRLVIKTEPFLLPHCIKPASQNIWTEQLTICLKGEISQF